MHAVVVFLIYRLDNMTGCIRTTQWSESVSVIFFFSRNRNIY